ncbi:MAG TPA: glycosyltransferase, partial [Cyclobacteriaceae bacterium]|nr:glycosyltransferase [Cyclobacteriaceae bacterium]
MNNPLVSVICVCYNHAAFVDEALRSVAGQTWPQIQLIVVDDQST